MDEASTSLNDAWRKGYSIAELWGFTKPASRDESALDEPHLILWGILSIVEYQVDRGAGHNYLRDRLRNGDWIAVGYIEADTTEPRLTVLPPIAEAQFGRKRSAIGDGMTKYVDVRIVHSRLFAEITEGRSESAKQES